MSSGEAEHGAAKAGQRMWRWLLFSGSVALLLIAWLSAQYPPISKGSAIEDVSISYNLIAGGAVPWFLQWAGVTCAILACCHARNTAGATVFAISTSFTVAIIWWCGRVCRVGIRARHFQVNDYVRFVVAMLPCFLPPFIRLGIQIARTR